MKRIKEAVTGFYTDDAVLRNFIKGSFWAVYGNVVVKGFSLIASIIIARLTGSGSFGELSIIKTTLSVFSLFATFGLGVTVTKFVAESRRNNIANISDIISAANAITIVTGMALAMMIIVFAPFISINILQSANLETPLRIAGVYLFFNALNVYQVGVIAGLESFRELARINLFMGVITLPVLLVFTYYFGLNGTLLGMTINLVINWYLNRVLIKRKIRQFGVPISYNNLGKNIRLLLTFSYPLAIKEIIYSLSNWCSFYLLMFYTDYNQVGVFSSANQLAQLILFLPASVMSVFLSQLSNQVSDSHIYSQLVRKNILITIFITTGIGLAMVLLSNYIYAFYGVSYEGGENVLYILVAATVPMALVSVFEQIFVSSSKPGFVTIFQFVIQCLILSSALVLFSMNKAATSLAYAFLIGYSVTMVVMYVFIKNRRFINSSTI